VELPDRHPAVAVAAAAAAAYQMDESHWSLAEVECAKAVHGT